MSGRARGIGAGGAVAGLGALAHATAGGGVEPRPLLVVAASAVAVGGILEHRVRWTFGRALAAAAAAQPLLHMALDTGGHEHAHAAHHAAATSAEGRMWILHTVLAVVSAVMLRAGERWLRTMPALVRAALVGVAPAGPLPMAPPAGRWAAKEGPAPRAVVALAWSSRGPPSPA